EGEVDLAKVTIDNREMEMGFTLIYLLRKQLEPGEYRDTYRKVLGELSDAKLRGKEVLTSPPARDATFINLADALARSVAAARKSGDKAKPKSRSRSTQTRRTRKGTTRKAGRPCPAGRAPAGAARTAPPRATQPRAACLTSS